MASEPITINDDGDPFLLGPDLYLLYEDTSMPTGVELQIQKQMDNLAAWKKSALVAVEGRTRLWTLIDATGDVLYENRVKGTQIYDPSNPNNSVDGTLDNVAIGPRISSWFSLHSQYFQNDAPSLGSFSNALSTWKWRVHEYFAHLYQEVNGTKLTPTYVFPRDDLVFGSYDKTSSTFTAGEAVDETYAGGAKVAAEATVVIGGSNLVLTGTLVRLDDTTANITATLAANSTMGTQSVFGQQLLSGDATSGQKVVSIATTSQFKVGEPVLVEDDLNSELATVDSITTNTSLTLATNLRNAYTTTENAKVTPLFTGVTLVTHTGGTNGDAVDIVVAPDREVDLEAT